MFIFCLAVFHVPVVFLFPITWLVYIVVLTVWLRLPLSRLVSLPQYSLLNHVLSYPGTSGVIPLKSEVSSDGDPVLSGAQMNGRELRGRTLAISKCCADLFTTVYVSNLSWSITEASWCRQQMRCWSLCTGIRTLTTIFIRRMWYRWKLYFCLNISR